MKAKEVLESIIDKLKEKYTDLVDLKTNNSKLHTRIFCSEIENYNVKALQLILGKEEYPILECKLENGNYFLMTTNKMLSLYKNTPYSLSYIDYWWYDSKVREKYKSIIEGDTIIFKYYSLNEQPFWYEIDSFYPADIAHNTILNKMRGIYYPHTLPSLDLIKHTGFSDEPGNVSNCHLEE
jgi:hypothetical protein